MRGASSGTSPCSLTNDATKPSTWRIALASARTTSRDSIALAGMRARRDCRGWLPGPRGDNLHAESRADL